LITGKVALAVGDKSLSPTLPEGSRGRGKLEAPRLTTESLRGRRNQAGNILVRYYDDRLMVHAVRLRPASPE
jgi:hypothetical protein